MADIASSVHGVLVRLGDGGALGALSDSVEPSLLEELPLVSLEAVSVVSSVPVVDEEPGLLSDVPLVSAALLSVDGPVQAHCHDPLLAALLSPALEYRWLESSG